MTIRQKAKEIWPVLAWRHAKDPRENTPLTWSPAYERSPREAQDLRGKTSSLRLEGCKDYSSAWQGLVGNLATKTALKRGGFAGEDRPVDQDFLSAEFFIANHADFMTHEPLVKGLTF